MIIHRLELENIRLFKGLHILDLTPINSTGEKKPIILIGGKNGAGKTTLFESVLLCLYGSYFGDVRLSVAKYDQFIKQMVSVTSSTEAAPITNAHIELVFDFSHSGRTYCYTVRREWQIGKKIAEKLTIKRDGTLLSDVEADQWQDFLNELIPPRFSHLFLFDGEKIQNLVEHDETNLYLRDSFKSLLGLDIVERLKTDLGIYITKYHRLTGSSNLSEDIDHLHDELNRLDNELMDCLQSRAQLQSKHDQMNSEINRQEGLLALEGGGFAQRRDEYKADQNLVEEQIRATEASIRELAAGLLPFAITPQYCERLKERLNEEKKVLIVQQSREMFRTTIGEVLDDLNSEVLWQDISIDKSQLGDIVDRLKAVLRSRMIPTQTNQSTVTIHHLSDHDNQKLLNWIDRAINDIPHLLTTLTDRLEILTVKRQRINEMIKKAPDDEVIAPYIHTLNDLHLQLGQTLERIRVKDEEVRSLQYSLKECERVIEKKIEETKQMEGVSIKVSLAGSVQSVLEDYIAELQEEKLVQLAQTLRDCFVQLLRKDDYIKEILIDPHTYTITLNGYNNQIIAKDRLSAGEKEIFAISMLWALTLTSGRQLPFIIDTPLGRLDSDHRGNLVKDFFQHAGDQMIIFSTDTEIDQAAFKELTPQIARAYHLDYNQDNRATQITSGYFWCRDEKGVST